MNQFWNQRFAGDDHKYGTAANAFLREQATLLAPASRVLLPGEGEGRNSVWLAGQGHLATAMDSASVGLAKTARWAAANGVAVQTVCADLVDWTPPAASFDAVALIFVHLPSAWRRNAHRRLAAALVPGGWLLLECFHPRQLGRSSGGPRDADMLVSIAQLRGDFRPLCDEHLAWEGEVTLDEGSGHQGPAIVTRWVGRRKAASAAAPAA